MKKIILSMILLTSTIFALHWSKDLKTALATAKKTHKPLMVFVEGEYCRWCKKLEHRTLTSNKIEKRLKKYIVVKVERDDESVAEFLPEIQGVPRIFFMTYKGKILEDILGYWDIMDFSSYIDDVEKKLKKHK